MFLEQNTPLMKNRSHMPPLNRETSHPLLDHSNFHSICLINYSRRLERSKMSKIPLEDLTNNIDLKY